MTYLKMTGFVIMVPLIFLLVKGSTNTLPSKSLDRVDVRQSMSKVVGRSLIKQRNNKRI